MIPADKITETFCSIDDFCLAFESAFDKRLISSRVKSTIGWFYGFKLHRIINDKDEILKFVITLANVHDRTPLKNGNFLKKAFGNSNINKGCFAKDLFQMLF